MRNFQLLAQGLDTTPILNALARSPELWNADTIRTRTEGSPHAQVDDILLRFEDTSVVGAGESLLVVNHPAFYMLPCVRPVLFDLMRRVEGEVLGRVVISRLPPGGVIPLHRDLPPHCPFFDRYQVALQADDTTEFLCGVETITMQSGSVWWFNNGLEHMVSNYGPVDRLALIVDIRTFK